MVGVGGGAGSEKREGGSLEVGEGACFGGGEVGGRRGWGRKGWELSHVGRVHKRSLGM